MFFTVATGILGVLTAMIKDFSEPPYRNWMVGIMIATTIASAVCSLLNERKGQQEADDSERRILARGGYPTVMVRGFAPVPQQIVNGRVLAEVVIMNRSDVPVLDCRVNVMHLVGVPHGFNGSDSNIYP